MEGCAAGLLINLERWQRGMACLQLSHLRMRLGMVFYNEKKLSLYAGAVVRAVYSPKMFRRQAD